MSGAEAMCVMSALRSGVGLCTAASTEEVLSRVSSRFLEATLLPLEEDSFGSIAAGNSGVIIDASRKMSAISIGCGLSVTPDTKELVKEIITSVSCPVILDADGINCITDCIDIIRNTKCSLILTPHKGELKRLYSAAFGESDAETADTLTMAVDLAREYDVTVAAKGVPNFIAGDGKLYVCKAGNPGLSRGGSGDVLTGVVAAFAAMGLAPTDAAAAGVFVHGKAADIARETLSEMGMLPTDVIKALPFVFREWNR
jgi:NAD(P)H-hydrate epimerase